MQMLQESLYRNRLRNDFVRKNDLSDSQALQVSLDVLYPANAIGDAADTSQDTSEISQPVLYQISAWQVIATREWNGDNSLNLMNK